MKLYKIELTLIFVIIALLLFVIVMFCNLHGALTAERKGVDMNVSAYCTCVKCCGEYADGITASGKPAKGLICAAPPEYPFGTKFDVDGVVYVCEDRGGLIKGNKLDLLFPSHQAALNYGRKTVKVRILK
jgi:3D (Asp-Asp-Asp) domain-containing protein